MEKTMEEMTDEELKALIASLESNKDADSAWLRKLAKARKALVQRQMKSQLSVGEINE